MESVTQTRMERIKPKVSLAVNVVGIAALVFYGGSMWKTVAQHEERLTVLERSGTPPLQRHEAMDTERIDSLRQRISTVENALIVVADMRGDLKVIQSKLDKLNEELKAHERSSKSRSGINE